MNPQQFDVWKEDLEPVLILKVDEFHLLGYEEATKELVWQAGIQKLRKQPDYVPFYQFVNSFMRLSVTDYMNHVTISAYRGEMDGIDSNRNDLESLLDDVLRH
ncbi:hypothetical protein DH09_08670 [Bacillaceae bacterium JMAK1]|nr:hypothetical protein DH09_08670 [Bacillaceae bacterium JMAK1]